MGRDRQEIERMRFHWTRLQEYSESVIENVVVLNAG